MRFPRVGIVTGVADEGAAFRPDAAREAVGEGPLAVDLLRHGGRDLFLACAGIGKVAAATAATVLRARHGVDLLLVIGTAGGVAGKGEGPFLVTEAMQADFGAQRPDGLVRYTPGAWPIGEAVLTAFAAMPVAGVDLPVARIATSDLFVECGVHAAALRDALDVTLVDMETAAVAQAAAILGVPWLAIKATTDAANEDSAAGFQANLARAARNAAAAMERVLSML